MVLESHPEALNIFLTKHCNLDCHYCFVKKDSCKDKELDVEQLKKAVVFF
ncbi:MAG: hypothetical protein NTW18_06200 [Candidatus Omnitrophica bacterium]|nr:hypothetical protein [Candidatus Omnitrophota bacterium]